MPDHYFWTAIGAAWAVILFALVAMATEAKPAPLLTTPPAVTR